MLAAAPLWSGDRPRRVGHWWEPPGAARGGRRSRDRSRTPAAPSSSSPPVRGRCGCPTRPGSCSRSAGWPSSKPRPGRWRCPSRAAVAPRGWRPHRRDPGTAATAAPVRPARASPRPVRRPRRSGPGRQAPIRRAPRDQPRGRVRPTRPGCVPVPRATGCGRRDPARRSPRRRPRRSRGPSCGRGGRSARGRGRDDEAGFEGASRDGDAARDDDQQDAGAEEQPGANAIPLQPAEIGLPEVEVEFADLLLQGFVLRLLGQPQAGRVQGRRTPRFLGRLPPLAEDHRDRENPDESAGDSHHAPGGPPRGGGLGRVRQGHGGSGNRLVSPGGGGGGGLERSRSCASPSSAAPAPAGFRRRHGSRGDQAGGWAAIISGVGARPSRIRSCGQLERSSGRRRSSRCGWAGIRPDAGPCRG